MTYITKSEAQTETMKSTLKIVSTRIKTQSLIGEYRARVWVPLMCVDVVKENFKTFNIETGEVNNGSVLLSFSWQ